MDYVNPDALVSTAWLEQHLDAPDVRIVDATYYLPGDERNAVENYALRHIPGAVYFNIDEICDSDVDLPHMLPSSEKFSSKVRKLGLGDGNRIIVYDSAGGYMAACRVWWMFRIFGHKDVAVLDGGLPKWEHEKRPVNDDEVRPQERHFSACMNNTLVKNVSQMIKNIIFRSAAEIKAAFDGAKIDMKKPIAASCGSGITAAVITFALYLIGNDEVAVYDGSWAEWGDHPDTPVDS
jgi:thiosulfate/3-mercaptopyruvate sulfurtransferase